MDYKYYNLLFRMGVPTQPVQPPYSTCYPTYLSYFPPCTSYDPPPPIDCSQHLSTLTDEERSQLIDDFTTLFPELKGTPHDPTVFYPSLNKLQCLYPDFTCVDTPCSKMKLFLLLAHYHTLDLNQNDSINSLSSSSVGDVSLSYDTTHTQRLSPFFIWLSKTPYGRELIALLKSKPGIVVV